VNPISDTKKNIITYLSKNPNSKVVDIIRYLDLSKQAVQKHLKELIEINAISKVGSPPIVFYKLSENNKAKLDIYKNKDFYDFNYIDAAGNIHTSYQGFVYWCNERGFNVEVYMDKWIEIRKKYEKYKTNGLISASNKFQDVFGNECFVDEAFFSEFSSREIFGKTALYEKLLISKQVQDKHIFKNVFGIVKPTILRIIEEYKIQYVVFVPPTVKRNIQLMTEFEKYLDLDLPKIKVIKIKNDVSIPQKTLSKPSERRTNAIETFMVTNNQYFNGNILIIDDFIGSGSSINYIGKKIKEYKTDRKIKIIGYAICGSANGIIDNSKKFEIINEV
jgi:DNA-binding MarR family transcriptional regulator